MLTYDTPALRQTGSKKMEELCEEIEVLIDMNFNLPTLVFLV
jgi:hypothetical protein